MLYLSTDALRAEMAYRYPTPTVHGVRRPRRPAARRHRRRLVMLHRTAA